MLAIRQQFDSLKQIEVVRYAVNGLVATAVHYCVLQINLTLFGMTSVGLANFVAAFFGIFMSYFGSRYFVFRARRQPILKQLTKFGGLYILSAVLHGLLLYAWSDLQRWDYRVGFLMATAVQFIISFWGNKTLVFNK
jgi:putative flippase GtrA